MYTQYNLHTQPLASSSQPQVTPSYRHQSSRLPTPTESSQGHRMAHPHQQGRSTALIGQPIYFSTGPFEGQTIRMELHEIQKADLGRKYARVDRRPLDPPPVVLLKMFEILDAGTDRQVEKEMEYELSDVPFTALSRYPLVAVAPHDVHVLGLLCTVDLFPVPGPDSIAIQTNHDHSDIATSAPPTQTTFFSSPSPSSSSSTSSAGTPHHHTPHMHSYRSNLPSMSSPSGARSKLPNHFSGYIIPSDGSTDIVHHINGYPITENSKQTQALVGATFVQPVVMDYQGSKAIIFVFADLAVKIEGYFILRYRVFDIFGRPYSDKNDHAISAQCYGGTFRVYSTKEFPGLSASTELTKRLSLWGVRLNIRVTERRRRKRSASDDGRRSPTPDGDE